MSSDSSAPDAARSGGIGARPDFSELERMYADHLSAPSIYHASAYWDRLNRLNVDWLKTDGIENFKRTVNNNYFNWMVNPRSPYLRNVLHAYLRGLRHNPGSLLDLLAVRLADSRHRTFVSGKTTMSWFARKLYAVYVLALYEFALRSDELGLLAGLEEPAVGNPLTISHAGRRISQDLANSYLEYGALRKWLGPRFKDLNCIAEIGGGYGRLAWLLRALHGDSKRIVLVDLPPALFIARWYLGTVFPTALTFGYKAFTQFEDVRSEFEDARVCFLLPHQLELLPDGMIDLLLNISSFQEMSLAQIRHYYGLIDHKARHFYTKQWLYWENPEDHVAVPAVVYPTGREWDLLGARRNPVHSDFFEALFEVHPS